MHISDDQMESEMSIRTVLAHYGVVRQTLLYL